MTPAQNGSLRVAIDARLASGVSGGVEQVVIGLAAALRDLDGHDGAEYLFVANPEADEWLRPHLGGPCRLLHTDVEYPGQGGLFTELKRVSRRHLPVRNPHRVLSSDGTIESAGVDVVHFPMQEAFLTDVPSIYQPHDLQHLHLPEMFEEFERERREFVYRTHCERARLVVSMTSWGRRDLIQSYSLPPEKVAVVPGGSVLDDYPEPSTEELAELRRDLGLPDQFLLYPAQTWPHKNHLTLLEALAEIAGRENLRVPLVGTGRHNEHYPAIEQRVRDLGLEDIVSFPGFVSPSELRGLYSLATALVFPSRFEGWGLPVCEAFSAGLPVASSTATGLPEVVGDAGLLFDPEKPAEIAEAILRLWRDPALRETLAERGRKRASIFSFDHFARLFRAHYRQIADRPLTDEDRNLLASPPLA